MQDALISTLVAETPDSLQRVVGINRMVVFRAGGIYRLALEGRKVTQEMIDAGECEYCSIKATMLMKANANGGKLLVLSGVIVEYDPGDGAPPRYYTHRQEVPFHELLQGRTISLGLWES